MAEFEDETEGRLARHDMGFVPDVGETIVIKGADYTVISRRWKLGRLAPAVTVVVRPMMEIVS